jgi:transcriptional regulator with XRE-family HTH domain
MIVPLISGVEYYCNKRRGTMSFGTTIAEERKKAGMSQKDLAARIKKEDGTPISAQYLNDIERDRRNPPSDYILQQLADVLGLSKEHLVFLAGEYPNDFLELRELNPSPEQVEAAFRAFRKTIKGNQA